MVVSTLKRFTFVLVLIALVAAGCRRTQPEINHQKESNEVSPNELVETRDIKILNWNVLVGFNYGRSIDAGARWIDSQQPDIVALQEMNGFQSASLSQLAKRWEHEYTAIHKETGFPVALTSRWPIEVIEKRVQGCHHGYLHCKTHGIHLIVVHFWPNKLFDVHLIADKITQLKNKNEHLIVLGDFNTNSLKDSDFLAGQDRVQPIFDVVRLYESKGMVDLTNKFSPTQKYSCPGPITIPRWSANMEQLMLRRQRIDFIFANEQTAPRANDAKIVIDADVESISDHYPVVADFRWPINR